MILHQPDVVARPMVWMGYSEEWDDDGDDYFYVNHISVSPTRGACGAELSGVDLLRVMPDEANCEECWRLLHEHRGSIPPEDTTYGAEVGNRVEDLGGFTLRLTPDARRGGHTVGNATISFRIANDTAAEWGESTRGCERQTAFAVYGLITYSPDRAGYPFGRRPVCRVTPGPAGAGAWVVPE